MSAIWIVQDSGLPAQIGGNQIFKEEGFFEIFKQSLNITYRERKDRKIEIDRTNPNVMVAKVTTGTGDDELIDEIKAHRYEVKEVADHL